jgi:Flp pilus assembly protein TadG
LTEFAIVAPILLALAFGIFDFGRGMSANVTVTNSSREGARFLATHAVAWTSSGSLPASQGRFNTACPTGSPATTAPVLGSAQGAAWRQLQAANLDLTSVTMTVRFYKSDNDPSTGTADDTITCSSGVLSESSGSYTPQTGDWVQFQVHYTYTPVTPIISSLVHSVSMDQTTTMVLE